MEDTEFLFILSANCRPKFGGNCAAVARLTAVRSLLVHFSYKVTEITLHQCIPLESLCLCLFSFFIYSFNCSIVVKFVHVQLSNFLFVSMRLLLFFFYQLVPALIQYSGRNVRGSDLFGQNRTPLSLTRRFFKGLKVGRYPLGCS